MLLRPDMNGMLLELPADTALYQVVNGKRCRVSQASSVSVLFIPGARVIAEATPDEPSTAIRWKLSTD